MGFVVLIAVGSVLGWLASILSRTDDGAGVALNVAVGAAGALVVGVLASSESLLVGLSANALLLAMAAAVTFLGGFNLARGKLAQKRAG